MYGLFGNMQAHPGQREALIGHLLHAAALLRVDTYRVTHIACHVRPHR
jgi:hypothetical protein